MLGLSLFAISSNAQETPCLDGAEDVQVEAIVDAVTIALVDGRALRLAGIEPIDLIVELADAESRMMERLTALSADGALQAKLVSQDTDRYGRLPAMVVANGILVQELLAREGLAVAFAGGDPLPCFDSILAAEEDARRHARGFWIGGDLPWARPQDLEARIGRFAIFEGNVVSVGNRSARTYLNFGYRWTEDVTVEIAAGRRERFGGEAFFASLAGQRLRVRGYVTEKDGPMVEVSSPMQIEQLAPAAPPAGEAP